MGKSIAAVVLLAAALFAADRFLTAREGAERAGARKVGRLVPPEEREGKAAGSIEIAGGGGSAAYALGAEGWRCTSYRNAPASGDRIQSLVQKLLESEGLVLSRDPASASQFGFDGPAMRTVTLRTAPTPQEPQGKAIASIDVGNAYQAGERCHLRRHGEAPVWLAETDPHPELEAPPGGLLPPLLDPSLVPMVWLQGAKRVRGLAIERLGAPKLELELRDKQISPEEMRQGKLPFDWYSKGAAGETLCDPQLALAFTSYLMRAPYLDVVDPQAAAALGFEQSIAKITLIPMEGAPADLFVANGKVPGRMLVYNAATKTAYELATEQATLLLPVEKQLTDPASPNPWRAILQSGGR